MISSILNVTISFTTGISLDDFSLYLEFFFLTYLKWAYNLMWSAQQIEKFQVACSWNWLKASPRTGKFEFCSSTRVYTKEREGCRRWMCMKKSMEERGEGGVGRSIVKTIQQGLGWPGVELWRLLHQSLYPISPVSSFRRLFLSLPTLLTSQAINISSFTPLPLLPGISCSGKGSGRNRTGSESQVCYCRWHILTFRVSIKHTQRQCNTYILTV